MLATVRPSGYKTGGMQPPYPTAEVVSPTLASCRNHPEREAIGICVRCRTRVCSECVTKVDGINYCVTCLAALATEGGEHVTQEAKPASRTLSFVAAGLMLVVLTLLTWGLVEAALPGPG